MSEDLIKALGYSNLDARLKRISDKMTHSIRAMYKQLDIDWEPNWYLVLILVRDTPNISVMEIANRLKFTHQSIDIMTKKMVNKGYLSTSKDKDDKRKTIFQLTPKAEERLPILTKIWNKGTEAIFELMNEDTTIIKHLEVLETNLEKSSFGERIIQKLND
ncbi:MarR family winged helix-turn-helix transcriptional regulator [Roseivirga misakiensis]|uniref:HTH marR-type domain-containing protein n=1 Tax=Roseivirga misakiensis TaxID=1563681 RepID=A0A1E5T0R4_9BACT|nr:MarR family transcriptional regulator [Roseivirga misakiensis]OEK04964.1 hypothetical protein BFP71_16165 [Roseivirga misakiensis]